MKQLITRQREILDLAKQREHVDVEFLTELFDVTPQTIRRDLNELCTRKLLERVHGGAVYHSGVSNITYQARQSMAADGKRRIGETAAALIPDNASLIMNIGTTTEQVARHLHQHEDLMVVTNNLNIANILLASSDAEVLIAGGPARRSDGGIVGSSAADYIQQFKVDFAVMGVSSIDEDGDLLDFDHREVRVSKTILDHARQVILVADSMKFQRSAPSRIGHISQVDTLVTDIPPSHKIKELCGALDVTLIVADSSAAL